jgi:hypothetical protein
LFVSLFSVSLEIRGAYHTLPIALDGKILSIRDVLLLSVSYTTHGASSLNGQTGKTIEEATFQR